MVPEPGREEQLDAVVDTLGEYSTRIHTDDPGAPLGDVEPLSDAFTEATVVGLGESGHGIAYACARSRNLTSYCDVGVVRYRSF